MRRTRIAIVTGGTQGIGFATAAGLRDMGYQVVVCSRSDAHVEAARAELGGSVDCRVCDVSDRDLVFAMFENVKAVYGSVDVLINNAAVLQTGPAHGIGPSDLDLHMRTNFYGAVWCMQAATCTMSGGSGLIVNVLATCLEGGRADQGAYAASKAALGALSDCFVKEQRERSGGLEGNVAVIKVMPRRTRTPMRSINFPNEAEQDCLAPENVGRAIVAAVVSYFSAQPALGDLVSGSVIRVT